MWEEHLFKLCGLLKVTLGELLGEALSRTVLCNILPCSGCHVSVLERGRRALQTSCVCKRRAVGFCSAKPNEMHSANVP